MINQVDAGRMANCYWSWCAILADSQPKGGFCACYFCGNPKRETARIHLCRYMFGHQCELYFEWEGAESIEVMQ